LIIETSPAVFDGAILMGGAIKSNIDPTLLQSRLDGGTYVFVTGRDDHARPEVLKTYRQFKDIKSAKTALIDRRNLGHELPKSATPASQKYVYIYESFLIGYWKLPTSLKF